MPRIGWPVANFELIEGISNIGCGLVDLWEASPVQIDSNVPITEAVIDILFPGNPLLCCGWSRHRFDTRARDHWYRMDTLEFIVPNPMNERKGLTLRGKFSAHALSATGPRRFLVVEFDFDARKSVAAKRFLARLQSDGRDVRDLCAALLLHLAEKEPMAMAVHSGRRSMHGWFFCAGVSEDRVRHFMEYAVCLGADAATWTRSQFVRMPDGLRNRRTRQPILFLNPEVV